MHDAELLCPQNSLQSQPTPKVKREKENEMESPRKLPFFPINTEGECTGVVYVALSTQRAKREKTLLRRLSMQFLFFSNTKTRREAGNFVTG